VSEIHNTPSHAAARLLEGQYALVTGGSRGIGRAVCEVLASSGARTALAARLSERAEAAARELSKTYGIPALGLGCDVSQAPAVEELFRRLGDWSGGRLDILVNNAGYPFQLDIWNTPLHALSEAQLAWFEAVFRTDTLGAVYCTRSALRMMIPQKSGKIIFVASTPAIEGYRGTPYTAAKAAILGLMKDVAREYGQYNIRANALALGNIQTPATFDTLDVETRLQLEAEAPLRRWGLPEEAGRAALFLASDLSSFVTGQTLIVDGGTLRR
jgi:NAD(P)-dependent dehydrogenase (short-subunit alcohol dehydrogenase family)